MMMRLLAGLIVLMSVASVASAQMDAGARRDYIAACMFDGGFNIQGREPPLPEKGGIIDINRTVRSWVNEFNTPSDKFKAGQEIMQCLRQVQDADRSEHKLSRINPKDNDYVDLALNIEPLEYAKGEMCSNPEMRQNLLAGRQLRQLGGNLSLATREKIDGMVLSLAGLDKHDPLVKGMFDLDPTKVDCSRERVCQIRGSVPIEIMTKTMMVFDIPMRQVKVLAGHCDGKIGFVNEKFIDF